MLIIVIFSCAFQLINGGELFEANSRTPVVVTTWRFVNATERAWQLLTDEESSAVDAVEAGCAVCEYEQCDFTVGYGGSPDESGETTLDAMIMDGTTMNVGAVGDLRNIKNAIGVARRVLDNTEHTLLVGGSATHFALEMGFTEENLTTPYSKNLYQAWKVNNCQPNYRKHVTPNPAKHCGPYKPSSGLLPTDRRRFLFGEGNHDTIGMVAVDSQLRTASGTSTNGLKHKIPGRVGDSPIAGAGSYASDEIGAAAATGDGDVMMRFLPAFVAVEEMMRGRSPEKAAQMAVDRIAAKHPKFRGGVIAVRKDGEFGAGCNGMETLPYCVVNPMTQKVKVLYKPCNNPTGL